MKRLLSLFKNKYFICAAAFITWMLFFDHNDFMSQWDYHQQLTALKKERAFYEQQTEQTRKELDELSTSKETLERFARERYHMKKQNEDVYVIIEEQPKEKKSFF